MLPDVSFPCQNCVVSPESWHPSSGTSHPAPLPPSSSFFSSFFPLFLLSFLHFPCSQYPCSLPSMCSTSPHPPQSPLFPPTVNDLFYQHHPHLLLFTLFLIPGCVCHLHPIASSFCLFVVSFFNFSPLSVNSLTSNLSSDPPWLSCALVAGWWGTPGPVPLERLKLYQLMYQEPRRSWLPLCFFAWLCQSHIR